MYLLLILYFFVAATFTLAKYSLNYAKPLFFVGTRMILAGILLLGWKFLGNRNSVKIKHGDLRLFLGVAVFHIFLAFVPEFWALQYLTSTKTNLIYTTTPFIAALLDYWLFREKITKHKLIGALVGITGLIPLFLSQTDPRESMMSLLVFSFPELVLLTAVISATYAWFLIKRLIQKGYSLITINGFAMLVGGLMSLFSSFWLEGLREPPVFNLNGFLLMVLVMIIISNVITYNFYAWLIKRYTITFVSFAGFLSPIFGAFLGWLFLNETFSWYYVMAFIFILTGLIIFYKDEINRSKFCRMSN